MDTALLNPDNLFAPSKFEEQKLRDTIERLEKANNDLHTRNDLLVLRVETIRNGFNEKVEDLAKVHTLIKDNQINDAVYELERLLDGLDGEWRCLA